MKNSPLTEIEGKIETHTKDLKSVGYQSEINFVELLNKCIEGNELLNGYFVKYDPLEVSADNLKILHDQISQLLNITHLLRKQEERTENPTLAPLWDLIAGIVAQSPDESSKSFLQKIHSDENREAKQQFTSGVEEALRKFISARKNINLSRRLIIDKTVDKEDAERFLSNLDACMEDLRMSIQYLEGLKLLLQINS